MYKLISITKSNKEKKKWTAKFYNKITKREKNIDFGASGYDDYTITKDKEQRERYRTRHKNDNLSSPISAGALSYYILWGDSTSMKTNIREFKKKFGV